MTSFFSLFAAAAVITAAALLCAPSPSPYAWPVRSFSIVFCSCSVFASPDKETEAGVGVGRQRMRAPGCNLSGRRMQTVACAASDACRPQSHRATPAPAPLLCGCAAESQVGSPPPRRAPAPLQRLPYRPCLRWHASAGVAPAAASAASSQLLPLLCLFGACAFVCCASSASICILDCPSLFERLPLCAVVFDRRVCCVTVLAAVCVVAAACFCVCARCASFSCAFAPLEWCRRMRCGRQH